MLSQIESSVSENNIFKKGMTLDEYLSEMDTLDPGNASQQHNEEDLYVTSKTNGHSCSKNILTYQIRESEEDNYQESHDQKTLESSHSKGSGQISSKDKRKSNKNLLNFPPFSGYELGLPLNNSRGFRVRKQSNSPFNSYKKQAYVSPPKKSFAMTFLNGDWKNQIGLTTREMSPTSTIYGKFMRNLKQNDSQNRKHHSKQKYFQKKNSKDIQHVTKYERQLFEKYSRINLPQVLQMRVQGITDRLHQRKGLSIKTHK